MPAGDNEKLFRALMTARFGRQSLAGKRRFTVELPGFDSVSISVDESISVEDRLILVEIDSGNMAKLIAGQYALINGLCKDRLQKTLFLVVHYYTDRKSGVMYSPNRTLKNLNAIQHFNPTADWIPFNAFNIGEFKRIVEASGSLEELVENVWPRLAV